MENKLEPLYIVDTHPIVWYLQGSSKRLSQTAMTILASAEKAETKVVSSAIVVAELYYVHQKGILEDDFKEIYENLKRLSSLFLLKPTLS